MFTTMFTCIVWIKIYNLASYISFAPSVLYFLPFLPYLGKLEHILYFHFISTDLSFIPFLISYSFTRVYNIYFQLIWVNLQMYTSSCVKTYKSIFLILHSVILLGWYKSNCGFILLKFAVSYWNTFLNKCGYVIHHFNVQFSLYFSANDLLCVCINHGRVQLFVTSWSRPGSYAHGILQARILEWVAISSSIITYYLLFISILD